MTHGKDAMNTVNFRGIQKMSELDDVTVTRFPMVEDMSIDGRTLINELQKMIDECEDDSEGQDVHFGLKIAISTAKSLQEKAYHDFLAACKLTQV